MIAAESVVSKLSGSFAEWSSSMCRSPAPDIRWHDRFRSVNRLPCYLRKIPCSGLNIPCSGFRDSLFH